MDELDFTIELNAEGIGDQLEADIFAEADARLRRLAQGHRDMRGAAVNVREAGTGEKTYLYEVTAVAYIKPSQIAATEKHEDPMTAAKNALDAVERQVREKREKKGKPWQQPDSYVSYEEAVPEVPEEPNE